MWHGVVILENGIFLEQILGLSEMDSSYSFIQIIKVLTFILEKSDKIAVKLEKRMRFTNMSI